MCLRERLPRAKTGERKPTAIQLLKGSAAFTSALLFGNGETKGLVRTIGAAFLDAGKNASQAIFRAPTQTSSEEERDKTVTQPGPYDSVYHNGWREGPDGHGYYVDGHRMD